MFPKEMFQDVLTAPGMCASQDAPQGPQELFENEAPLPKENFYSLWQVLVRALCKQDYSLK